MYFIVSSEVDVTALDCIQETQTNAFSDRECWNPAQDPLAERHMSQL